MPDTHRLLTALALSALLVASAQAEQATEAGSQNALGRGFLGLYDTALFEVVDGRCPACVTPRQALWYFEGDLVAVPRNARAMPAPASRLTVADDIKQWVASGNEAYRTPPFMVWLGAPQVIEGARLPLDGQALELGDGSKLPVALVPKLPSNRSYYDSSTTRFFSKRELRLRGQTQVLPDGSRRFVARVIWPEDFHVSAGSLKPQPLGPNETLGTLIESDAGGAESAFSTRLLWKRDRTSSPDLDHKAVLAFILNGAQADDDEAHGGHFAVVTGWHRRDGRWADWMVNNFYNLDIYSEKGIIASMLPIDNYLMDFNSGQSYYRPSYLLVAVLRESAAAEVYQNAIQRVYDRLYRHEIEYDHAKANCVGISIDTLAGLGWQVPRLGPTSRARAVLGYYYSSVTDLSFASARRTYRYLTAERTRLYPRVAFETLGADLLTLVSAPNRTLTAYEQMLRDHTEAIVFVRVPQIPSSRAFGSFPVASFDEYMARVPKDRKDWKIIPVDPKPFPTQLLDHMPVAPFWSDTRVGLLAYAAPLACIAVALAWWRVRQKKHR